jgi:hypothetical protein
MLQGDTDSQTTKSLAEASEYPFTRATPRVDHLTSLVAVSEYLKGNYQERRMIDWM